VVPARLLETRSGPDDRTIDGDFQATGPLPDGGVIELTVADRGGLPDQLAAVMLNITAVTPHGPGHITVWPCGAPRPHTSNLNYNGGDVTANAVLAKVGTNGKVCLTTHTATHLIVDVNGYVPHGSGLHPVVPARLLETRSGPDDRTIDGDFQATGPLPDGGVIELTVADRGGLPDQLAAVMLNITAVTPHGPGHITVWPCGAPRPHTSNLNYNGGD